MDNQIQYKRIRLKDVPKVSKIMAECFIDYPLYKVFFPDESKRFMGIYYFFCARNACRRKYTYIVEDEDAVISLKKPGDKEGPIALCAFNFILVLHSLPYIKLSTYKLIFDYSDLAEKLEKKYYDPKTDNYFQLMCTKKASRSKMLFFKIIDNLDGRKPMYLETHTEKNVELYKHYGCQVLETTSWHGVPYYVMKRPASEPRL